MFPSPTGNREQNMLRLCKAVAERAGLDPSAFDLKTFRSTYATRMLRQGFDVRTVQDWMGHKVARDHDALPGSRDGCARSFG
jgi:site-specific recombinase XerD